MNAAYKDLAIILAWPDTTIRGDEKWMMFFRKIGVVKNLNFKVGHTGIILVERNTGQLHYYDFGRYISPRGLGRARSKKSDPRLAMKTKAILGTDGSIENLKEIAEEVHLMEQATQGFGKLFFSVAEDISFSKAIKYADELVKEGSTPYGAVARGNNNCSRFITRLLMKASKRYHFFHGINWPETLKASPISNVVNVRLKRDIHVFDLDGTLQSRRMNRWQSLLFLIKQVGDNLSKSRAQQFEDDQIIGSMAKLPVPPNLPADVQWLGGVGEGAWFDLKPTEGSGVFEITRFTEKGVLEYKKRFQTLERLPTYSLKDVKITYDSHLLLSHIVIHGHTYKLFPMEQSIPVESLHLEAIKNSPKILQVG